MSKTFVQVSQPTAENAKVGDRWLNPASGQVRHMLASYPTVRWSDPVLTAVSPAVVTTIDGPPTPAVAASVEIDPTGDDNALLWTAVTPGATGNLLTVEYVLRDEEEAALAFVVEGNAIQVLLETDDSDPPESVTTADDVVTAAALDETVAALVEVTLGDSDAENDGSGVLPETAATPLADGEDADPFAQAGALFTDGDFLYVCLAGGQFKEITLDTLS